MGSSEAASGSWCRTCGYRHTVPQRGKEAHLKRQAVELYLEEVGFRSIGRFLQVSHATVYNWIRSCGEKLEELRSSNEIAVVEMDAVHTYIGAIKNACWIWIAVDRAGRVHAAVVAPPRLGVLMLIKISVGPWCMLSSVG